MSELSDEDKRRRKVLMGPARLMPVDEEHYGLFRPVMIEGWDEKAQEVRRVESRENEPVGPLAVFREARVGEVIHMRSARADGSPLELTCVWDPSGEAFLRPDDPRGERKRG